MSSSRSGRPLVYCTKRALEDGQRVLPGVCLELAVEEAIRAENVRGASGGNRDGVFSVFGEDWAARCKRVPGQLRPSPRAWLVLSVARSQVRAAVGGAAR